MRPAYHYLYASFIPFASVRLSAMASPDIASSTGIVLSSTVIALSPTVIALSPTVIGLSTTVIALSSTVVALFLRCDRLVLRCDRLLLRFRLSAVISLAGTSYTAARFSIRIRARLQIVDPMAVVRSTIRSHRRTKTFRPRGTSMPAAPATRMAAELLVENGIGEGDSILSLGNTPPYSCLKTRHGTDADCLSGRHSNTEKHYRPRLCRSERALA